MTQPPIVPGQPEEPRWYQPPASPPPYQQGPYPPAQYPPQQPVPVYQVQQPDVVGRAATGTVTVIAVLFGIFCLLPLLVCGVMAMLGTFSNATTP